MTVCAHAEVNSNFHSKYEFDWIPQFFASLLYASLLATVRQLTHTTISKEDQKSIRHVFYLIACSLSDPSSFT
jgi:urate oxidase